MDKKQIQPNMGDAERLVSIVIGALLVLGILKRSSHMRMMRLAGGGYLLYRGISGIDPLYAAMDIARKQIVSQYRIR